jgi:hypothetical protein
MLFRQVHRPSRVHYQRAKRDAEQVFVKRENPLWFVAEVRFQTSK